MRRMFLVVVVLVVMLSIGGIRMEKLYADSNGDQKQKEEVFLPDAPLPGKIEYINPNPPDFETPKYEGEYYEALVPATLDLAERARLAVHALTSMTNPNIEYEQYFTVSHMSQPPSMDHNASDLHGHGKFMESLILMRTASGSLENMQVENAWIEMLLKMQGPDGLIYSPLTGRGWILPPAASFAAGTPAGEDFPWEHYCLLGFGTARALAALCMYAQKDPDGPWADAARNLFEGYDKVIIEDGDDAYLFDTWTAPGRPVEKPEEPFTGYLAGTQAWISKYLITYDRAQDCARATDLGEKMMNYNMFTIEYNEPSGRFKFGGEGVGAGKLAGKCAHFHTHAMNILACLYAYMETGNEKLLERAMKAYEFGISQGETLVGFFPMVTYDEYVGAQTAETCQVADMVNAAVTLSRMGYDRWDDVDRWVRNQLAENQLTQIEWLKDGHLDYSRSETPEGYWDAVQRTTERVAERTLGSFAGWPAPNDWVSAEDWWGGNTHRIFYTIMNCCTGSGCRALYNAWRSIVTCEGDTLRINLLMNRASKWADVESHVPYTGRVDVKVKKPLKLEIRLPEWVETGQEKVTLGGEAVDVTYDDRYVRIGKVNEGDTVTMTFPIYERTEKRTIEGFDYTFILRGNDVVQVDPPGKYCPMYQREHYRNGETLYRKVERFVPDDSFDWW